MSSVGFIINERSDRSASVLDDLLYITKRFNSVRTAVLDGVNGIDKALSEMGRKGVETLIIGGGDGTLQAAFTDLMNHRRFEHMPHYVALPCGMTNVIANDCGLRGKPAESLHNFLWRWMRGDVHPASRNLLSIRNGDQDPIYGFFIGAGAFHSAVEFSRSKIQARGAKRSLALGLSVASYVWKSATDPTSAEDSIELTLEESHQAEHCRTASQKLFMATTLHRLGPGLFPFWGDQSGPMAVTTVEQPASRLLRAAPFVLKSKSRPWFRDYGYHSWRDTKLVARFNGPFVFDGEIFEARENAPLTLDTSRHATFLY